MKHPFIVSAFPWPFSLGLMVSLTFFSCKKDENEPERQKIRLSEYNIYNGNPSQLTPNVNFKQYELASALFTDYAEKQRLIKLPPGTTMKAVNNGLFEFPEGTIIVKTFYYFNDKQNPVNGIKLIETRILELKDGKWMPSNYLWNDQQTDAFLIETGLNKTVNWIDEKGNPRIISYHIPNDLECRTCHNSNNVVIPIGPKVRNLNREVKRNNQIINQLSHLQNEGILSHVTPEDFMALPNCNDETKTIDERGRAYLDINCAHCHNDNGFASGTQYRFGFEMSLKDSRIPEGKSAIEKAVAKGKMPKIGTTVIDKEGLELITKFLEKLQ